MRASRKQDSCWWKGVLAGLVPMVALLVVSCAGTRPSVSLPNVDRIPSSSPTGAVSASTEGAGSPPGGEETSSSNQEVLIHGSPETVISSPEPDKAVNVEFILDASGSMLERVGGKAKVEIAKEVISNLVQELPPTLNLGLRVYGHRYPEADKGRSCEDIQLLTPMGQGNGKRLAQELQEVRANGWTPIAKALELAAQDVAAQGQNVNNVVLLSDGQETCGGRPIEVAQGLKDGPIGLTVHPSASPLMRRPAKNSRRSPRFPGALIMRPRTPRAWWRLWRGPWWPPVAAPSSGLR